MARTARSHTTENARAKIFTNGRTPAVRLPREFRFEGKVVAIRQEGDAVWALLNLELWYRTFIDGSGIQTLPEPRGARSDTLGAPRPRPTALHRVSSPLRRDAGGPADVLREQSPALTRAHRNHEP